MDGRGRGLAGGEEARDHLVGYVRAGGVEVGLDDLAEVIGGDAAHVVVHGGQDRDGFFGDVDAGEDGRRLGDAGQPFGQEVRGEVIQMKVAVILLGSDAPALPDLHGHGPADDVPAGQVLGGGGVPFHEPLPLAVLEYAALPAAALRDEAAGAVDAGGVELHKLGVLIGEAGAHGHGVAVPRAGVGAGAGEVGAAVAARGEDGVLGAYAVHRPVLHVERQGPGRRRPVS